MPPSRRPPLPGAITRTNLEATIPSGVLSLCVLTTGNPLSAGSRGALVTVRVVDTQAGNQPWVITALASGAGEDRSLSAESVGLTGLTATGLPGNALTAADLTLADRPPAASGGTGYGGLGGSAPHVIVTDSGQADGTISVSGLLTFSAGAFAGTVTVTIAS